MDTPDYQIIRDILNKENKRMEKRLKDFMEMCGQWEFARVVIWDTETEKNDDPLFEGLLSDIPYWLAIRKLVKNDPTGNDETCGISFRDNLGDGRPGLVITLESQEKKKKKDKKKK